MSSDWKIAVFFNDHLPTSGTPVTHVGEGEMAEWSIAPVLKTGGPKGPVGSNPTLSAISPCVIFLSNFAGSVAPFLHFDTE
jgi:hypothetical protein